MSHNGEKTENGLNTSTQSQGSQKPWGGRFKQATDPEMEAFTSSVHFDKVLSHYDIQGSIAHCRALEKAGVLTGSEAEQIISGLERVEKEIEAGELEFTDRLEDIHMHIEDRLTTHIGELAKKLHTGRSRNDQVATDVRLYLKDMTGRIIDGLRELRSVIVHKARLDIDVVMPGYTHLQRAQPILFSHHLMAYYEMFTRDSSRFRDALARIDVMPLGSAALAGTTYPIDRQYTAKLLLFSKPSANSIDAVSDRDFIMEFLAAASICMIHFSRMAEELVLWSSSEFGFIDLPDRFCTGSSIMPQKKNPDIPELVRGKSGRVIGSLVSLLVMMKGLPLAYNRDMQEDKEPLFDAVRTLLSCVSIFTKMIPGIKPRAEAMQAAATKGYLDATDFADYLAGRGMPFREAHHVAGRAVAYAIEKGRELHELSLDELKNFSNLVGPDIYDALDVRQMIERRNIYGGTARECVLQAIESAAKELQTEAQGPGER